MATSRAVSLRVALGLTVVAGAVGWFTDRVAVGADWRVPSFGYLAGELVWKGATLALLVWAIHRYDNRRVDAPALGFAPDPQRPSRPFSGSLFLVVAALSVVLAVTVGSAPGSTAADSGRDAGLGLVLAHIFVRYPLTVFAEESLFRGWLQPRLGANGLVWSSVLWAGYHLQQIASIPVLVLIGLGLGLLRWAKGDVRLAAATHYLVDVVFFVATYV